MNKFNIIVILQQTSHKRSIEPMLSKSYELSAKHANNTKQSASYSERSKGFERPENIYHLLGWIILNWTMPKPVHAKRTKTQTITNKKKINKTSIEKDFDQFRHEIYKLGLSGLDKKDQLDARVELAIKLGAQPKKWIRKHTNLGSDSVDKKKKKEEEAINTNLTLSNKKHHGKARKVNKHPKRNKVSSTRAS